MKRSRVSTTGVTYKCLICVYIGRDSSSLSCTVRETPGINPRKGQWYGYVPTDNRIIDRRT